MSYIFRRFWSVYQLGAEALKTLKGGIEDVVDCIQCMHTVESGEEDTQEGDG
jgi:hypothetical protein